MNARAGHDSRARRSLRHAQTEMTNFLYAIIGTAERIRCARDFGGSPALRFDPEWQLLRAIERCGGCPTISDVGRALGITRQSARAVVIRAEKAGVVELFQDPHDRRTIQTALTPSGRRALEACRYPDVGWLFTLLDGLEPSAMRETTHVLDVIAQRLARYESQMRASRARPRNA